MRRFLQIVVRWLPGVACVLVLLFAAMSLRAQKQASAAPYASIGARGVHYAGPGREAAFDLKGATIRIGILAPTHGPQKADGEAMITAARMAIADASRKPLPGGRRLALVVADESVPPWGILGDEIIHLVMQEKVVAIVTGADGVAAHLSEQIGNKIGVATLTLSGDDTATEINLPWIFRMGPSDTQQAQAMARNIYEVHGYRRVLLVTEKDHDGKMASEEYIQEARKLGAPVPDSVSIDPLKPEVRSLPAIMKAKTPEAVVLWTLPETAKGLMQAIRADGFHGPIYVSQKTAQTGSGLRFAALDGGAAKDSSGVYVVHSRQTESALRASFALRYQKATGSLPSPAAAQAYDAVRLVAQAVRKAGANRARVRDEISTARNLAGVSGAITFDSQGNNRAEVSLVRIQDEPIDRQAGGNARRRTGGPELISRSK